MYRALTLKALEEKTDIKDTQKLIEIASRASIDLMNNPDGSLKVLLDSRDVTSAVREPRITRFVSDIAKIRGIREKMLILQRRLGEKGNAVLDGRDIGTVVFPDAHKKFFLDADFQERVSRRFKELESAGQNVTLPEVNSDLHNRDTIDTHREFAPLKKAEDAIYIDTTNMGIEEVVNRVLRDIGSPGHQVTRSPD
jgi:cytidylate kinase